MALYKYSSFPFDVRPMVTFPAAKHCRQMTSTNLPWLVTQAQGCEQLAQILYAAVPQQHTHTITTVLWLFVLDYPGDPVPEETLTHPSSSRLYQLLPPTTIHSILLVQITCLAIFLRNLFPCPLWPTSWSGALPQMGVKPTIS